MRHPMMYLEFRQRPRSIYGKNRPTPATQFAFACDLDTVHTGPLHTVRPSPKQM